MWRRRRPRPAFVRPESVRSGGVRNAWHETKQAFAAALPTYSLFIFLPQKKDLSEPWPSGQIDKILPEEMLLLQMGLSDGARGGRRGCI